MSLLNSVTITGADSTTDANDLLNLSREYPFVEWGILVSSRREGSPRFPDRDWIDRFSGVAGDANLNVSMHVCGQWVRDLFQGELDWDTLPEVRKVCQRIQINTHAELHASNVDMMQNMRDIEEFKDREFIFQWDGVNDHITHAAAAYGLNVSALFDTSGGAGVLPKEWPAQLTTLKCGYAGGLGPLNVVEQVRKIEAFCIKPFWIDMERKVRTVDDRALDMHAVEAVLKSCAKHFMR